MKGVLLLVLGFAAFAAARPELEDRDLLLLTDLKQRQLFLLKLLNNVLQPVMYKEIEEVGLDFKLEDNVELFTKQDVVKQFLNYYRLGFLPRGEVFTLHVDRQLKEVVSMFHLLYYAKDFTSFIKTACWLRLYFNEGMFVYALTVAVRHREDCRGLILPPPYEIYPYYFVRADVIQKAYQLKLRKGLLDPKLSDFYGLVEKDKNVYIIDENVYDRRAYLNDEDRLRYFTEDIDLNTYYYYFHIDFPFWMRNDVSNKLMNRRFELTLYVYQQILARYYLERLSNGLGEIQDLSFDLPLKNGYWPWLMLHNGVQLPGRFNNYYLRNDQNTEILNLALSYEKIITEAILKGYIELNGLRYELTKPEDIENLGKLIYGRIDKLELTNYQLDAYRYLLILLKSVLGLNTLYSDNYFVIPSVLDSYQTALRDPVFYQLQKRLFNLLYLFKLRLPSYSREELGFSGVRLENISLSDKLVTYFEDYFMDLTNALTYSNDELQKSSADMLFYARKLRLNYKPFKLTLDVLSDKASDCVVRIFLGPKEDSFGRLLDLNRNRINFVELDSFVYKLNSGKNVIIRDSLDMHNLVGDRLWTRDFWKRLSSVTDIKDLLLSKELRNYQTGFPRRLLLPKGLVGGLKMLLYVIITPLRPFDNLDMQNLDLSLYKNLNQNLDLKLENNILEYRSTLFLDKMPLGFPFDRKLDLSRFFLPNMKFLDLIIFHENRVCDMKSRWERYVLRSYDYLGLTPELYNKSFKDLSFTSDLNTKI